MPPALQLSSMPDDLLDLILSWCLWHAWNSLRRVCKRWKAVVDTSPLMSRNVQAGTCIRKHLPDLEGAALVRLAAAKAGVAQEGYLRLAHLPGVLEAAQQLTGLTSLNLSSLASMAHSLLCLKLSIDCLRPATCVPLGELAVLTALEVGSFVADIPAELWASVARMPRLADLSVTVNTLADEEPCRIGSTAWAALAACTQLSRLRLEHTLMAAYEGHDAGEIRLSGGIAALTSLRSFSIEGPVFNLGDLWAHPTLTHLSLNGFGVWEVFPEAPLPALKRLRLDALYSEMTVVPHSLWQLAGLASVQLFNDNRGHDWEPLLAGLQQLPNLASLHMAYCRFEADTVPASLRRIAGLQALNLSSTHISFLPPGPYLGSLHTLMLGENKLTRVPPSLCQATALQVLDLSPHWNPERNQPGLSVDAAGLATLVRLHSLRLLAAPDSPATMLPLCALACALPGLLLSVSTRCTSLDRLPALPNGWDGGIDEEQWADMHGRLTGLLVAMRQAHPALDELAAKLSALPAK
ncbi:hypothetical protein ABPG75_011827 [Micractinium tetrahymenae]